MRSEEGTASRKTAVVAMVSSIAPQLTRDQRRELLLNPTLSFGKGPERPHGIHSAIRIMLDLLGTDELLAFCLAEHEGQHLTDSEPGQDQGFDCAQVLSDRKGIGVCVNQRGLTRECFNLDH